MICNESRVSELMNLKGRVSLTFYLSIRQNGSNIVPRRVNISIVDIRNSVCAAASPGKNLAALLLCKYDRSAPAHPT